MRERSSRDPKVRAAASVVAAGGAIAAAKVIREHTDGRRRDQGEPYRLQPGESTRDGVTRVARGQLDLTINLLKRAPRQHDGAEEVHEARKALKRQRALLRVSRRELGRKRYRRENVVLRDVARELSGTRDAQVLLETLDDLSQRFLDGAGSSPWAPLRESLAAGVEESQKLDKDHAAKIIDTLLDSRARVQKWSLSQNGGPQPLAGGFARVYRRGRRAYAAASSQPTTETLHELRKRAKDLWHAAQLLKSVSGKELKQIQRTAHHLSDLLGDDHDLAILREYADRHPELLTPPEAELLKAVIAYRQRALEDEALAVASKLYRRKPKKLLARLALT